MDNKPLFSIIIPIYNAEKYLKKAITSVLNQTFKNIELILVDDGSTDSSEQICKQFITDNRVRYYKMKNSGPLYARCYGAKRAEGEYILFCDADDYYLNNNCLNRLESLVKSNSVDLIQFGNIKKYHVLRKKDALVSKEELIERRVFYERDYPKLLCSFWNKSKLTLCVWNKVYHKRLIDDLPDVEAFDHVFMGDDLIFNLHVLKNCQKVLYTPDVLYCYRAIVGYSKKWNKKTMYDLNKIKSYQQQFLTDYNGRTKAAIEGIMYSEIAGWLLVHIIDGMRRINTKDMCQYIFEVLGLQQIQNAREYYINNLSIHYPAVDLLREGSPQAYIEYASNEVNQNRFRKRIKSLVRRII